MFGRTLIWAESCFMAFIHNVGIIHAVHTRMFKGTVGKRTPLVRVVIPRKANSSPVLSSIWVISSGAIALSTVWWLRVRDSMLCAVIICPGTLSWGIAKAETVFAVRGHGFPSKCYIPWRTIYVSPLARWTNCCMLSEYSVISLPTITFISHTCQ